MNYVKSGSNVGIQVKLPKGEVTNYDFSSSIYVRVRRNDGLVTDYIGLVNIVNSTLTDDGLLEFSLKIDVQFDETITYYNKFEIVEVNNNISEVLASGTALMVGFGDWSKGVSYGTDFDKNLFNKAVAPYKEYTVDSNGYNGYLNTIEFNIYGNVTLGNIGATYYSFYSIKDGVEHEIQSGSFDSTDTIDGVHFAKSYMDDKEIMFDGDGRYKVELRGHQFGDGINVDDYYNIVGVAYYNINEQVNTIYITAK